MLLRWGKGGQKESKQTHETGEIFYQLQVFSILSEKPKDLATFYSGFPKVTIGGNGDVATPSPRALLLWGVPTPHHLLPPFQCGMLVAIGHHAFPTWPFILLLAPYPFGFMTS